MDSDTWQEDKGYGNGGRDWSNSTISQGTPGPSEAGRSRSPALPTPSCWTPGLQTVREYIAVTLSHLSPWSAVLAALGNECSPLHTPTEKGILGNMAWQHRYREPLSILDERHLLREDPWARLCPVLSWGSPSQHQALCGVTGSSGDSFPLWK